MDGKALVDTSLRFHEMYVARYGLNEEPLELMEIFVQPECSRILAWIDDDGMEWERMIVAPFKVNA